jgi:prephenate dehydratase
MYFGQDVELLECDTFKEIPQALDQNKVDFGLMAIENSIAGSLLQNYRLLGKCDQEIIGEIYIQIEHCLMSNESDNTEDLKEVKSHPMALLQCEDFFENHKGIKLTEDVDTAKSAKDLSLSKISGQGVIASEMAADIYGLKILEKGIQTIKNNYTRFFVIGKNDSGIPEDANKASVKMILDHQSGSLAQVLSILSIHGLNLTKIQSFPMMEKPWEYAFYLDFIFPSQQTFESVMEILNHQTNEVQLLGVYKEFKRTFDK